mmetsp:Transcript_22638/g.47982  ORF Transcript_22638/g.47982 Transcript_22638/m.47982 type:complete len:365 (+) Transcript_22638:858-1952(+)
MAPMKMEARFIGERCSPNAPSRACMPYCLISSTNQMTVWNYFCRCASITNTRFRMHTKRKPSSTSIAVLNVVRSSLADSVYHYRALPRFSSGRYHRRHAQVASFRVVAATAAFLHQLLEPSLQLVPDGLRLFGGLSQQELPGPGRSLQQYVVQLLRGAHVGPLHRLHHRYVDVDKAHGLQRAPDLVFVGKAKKGRAVRQGHARVAGVSNGTQDQLEALGVGGGRPCREGESPTGFQDPVGLGQEGVRVHQVQYAKVARDGGETLVPKDRHVLRVSLHKFDANTGVLSLQVGPCQFQKIGREIEGEIGRIFVATLLLLCLGYRSRHDLSRSARDVQQAGVAAIASSCGGGQKPGTVEEGGYGPRC